MPETADIVVIGGGATGCSVAYHLAAKGAKVTLVEKNRLASGPTGASPAIVRQYYSNPHLTRLARDGLAAFHRWKDEIGGDCGFIKTGFMLGVGERDWDAIVANVAAQRVEGFDVELMTVSEMQQLQLDIIADGLAGGVFERDAGYCDPTATTKSLASATRRLGGRIFEERAVRRICVQGHTVKGVDTDAGQISAPVVVNAAGPWSCELARTAGMELPIRAVRHSIATLRISNACQWPRLVPYAERATGFYVRPHLDDLCFVGSLDPSEYQEVDPDHYSTLISDDVQRSHRARSARRLARLAEAAVVGGWASLFDETPDDNPIVGEDPGVSGSFIVAGLSGHGFKFCPVLGQAISDLLLNGSTGVPLQPFALERFAIHGRPNRMSVPDILREPDTSDGG